MLMRMLVLVLIRMPMVLLFALCVFCFVVLARTSINQVMRQVVPVWPECWGYSCTGPTTYFGPSIFNSSTSVAVDVRLEDSGSSVHAMTIDMTMSYFSLLFHFFVVAVRFSR